MNLVNAHSFEYIGGMSPKFIIRNDSTTDLYVDGKVIRNTACVADFEDFLKQGAIAYSMKRDFDAKTNEPFVTFQLSAKMNSEQKAIFKRKWLLEEPSIPAHAERFHDDQLDKWARVKQLSDRYGDEMVNSCLRKIRHLDRGAAHNALRGLLAESYYEAPIGKRLVAYACEHCCGFHVGHAFTIECISL